MKKSNRTPQGTPHSQTSDKTGFRWPKARTTEVESSCPRVGEDGNVAYPPFLVAYDSRREGENAIKERITKPAPKREVKK